MESGRLMEGGRLIGGRLIEVGLYVVDVVFSFFLHFIYALCFFIVKPDFCEGIFDTNLWNKVVRIFKLMYQSNRSFNIPPGQPPGHLNFWKIFGKFPPHRAEKLFKCPHPRENYQITVLTFQ